MRQNWIHTNRTWNGTPAIEEMRFGVSRRASVCANFDDSNGYCGLQQPNLGGLDRVEVKT